MGFKANNVITGKIPKDKLLPKSKNHKPNPPTLSQDSILFIIDHIGKSDFKGKDVERVFNTVLKLQEMYLYYEANKTVK